MFVRLRLHILDESEYQFLFELHYNGLGESAVDGRAPIHLAQVAQHTG